MPRKAPVLALEGQPNEEWLGHSLDTSLALSVLFEQGGLPSLPLVTLDPRPDFPWALSPWILICRVPGLGSSLLLTQVQPLDSAQNAEYCSPVCLCRENDFSGDRGVCIHTQMCVSV